MNYREIREAINNPKRKSATKHMETHNYGRFAIMWSEKTDAIIVDANVIRISASRRWCIDSCGYPVANINGQLIRLHDFVMALSFSDKPDGCYVDHINQDKLDNRINNLRFVSAGKSATNMPLKSDNTSGYTGVHKTKAGTYRAYITVKKRRIELGTYKNIEDARRARQEAEDWFGFQTRPVTIREKCNIAFLIEMEAPEWPKQS